MKLEQVGWELAVFLGIFMRILLEGEHHQSWSLMCFLKWNTGSNPFDLHDAIQYPMLSYDIVFLLNICVCLKVPH